MLYAIYQSYEVVNLRIPIQTNNIEDKLSKESFMKVENWLMIFVNLLVGHSLSFFVTQRGPSSVNSVSLHQVSYQINGSIIDVDL